MTRWLLLTFCIATTLAPCAETVVVGHVTEITLLPEGHARCPARCPALSSSESLDGMCVSNSCGCGEATIAVHEVVSGSVTSPTYVATYRLGEWCAAEFPLSQELILVSDSDSQTRWSPAEREPSGEIWFEVEPFERIAGIRASSLPITDGRSTVSALRRAAAR